MKYLPLVIICLLIGCSMKPDQNGDSDQPDKTTDPFASTDSDIEIISSSDYRRVFPDPEGRDYFPEGRASYYTKYLKAMEEPTLQAGLKKGVELEYRFTLLPSFDDPLAVRLTRKNGVFEVRAVKLKRDRESGRAAKINHDEMLHFSGDSAKTIDELINKKGFWKPLSDAEIFIHSGLDGSQWIFEIHDNAGYKMIDVWTPGLPLPSPELLKRENIDPSKLRDFMIYYDVGIELLRMTKLLSKPDA